MLIQLVDCLTFVCVGSKSALKDSVFALSCIIESLSNLKGININPFPVAGCPERLQCLGENRETVGRTCQDPPRVKHSASQGRCLNGALQGFA